MRYASSFVTLLARIIIVLFNGKLATRNYRWHSHNHSKSEKKLSYRHYRGTCLRRAYLQINSVGKIKCGTSKADWRGPFNVVLADVMKTTAFNVYCAPLNKLTALRTVTVQSTMQSRLIPNVKVIVRAGFFFRWKFDR